MSRKKGEAMTELDWRDLVLNLMYLLKAYEAQYTIPPTDKSVAIKGLAERMLHQSTNLLAWDIGQEEHS